MKILIIIPFFGKTPVWINYFIRSCEINTKFNWLLYGDLKTSISLPDNVKITAAKINDFNSLASKKLGFPISIVNPYKICDFRPVFGLIFEDFIQGYDFWGYSDLDLIYGTISTFISNSDLEQYDVITTKKNYIAGHFTLIRNNPKINLLYNKIFRIKFILKDSSKHYCIDERSNLTGSFLGINDKIISIRRPVSERVKKFILYRMYCRNLLLFDYSQLLAKEERKGNISILRETDIVSDFFYMKRQQMNWKVVWKNGQLKDLLSKKEIMYFHFIKSKYSDKFKINQALPSRHFCISHVGIDSLV